MKFMMPAKFSTERAKQAAGIPIAGQVTDTAARESASNPHSCRRAGCRAGSDGEQESCLHCGHEAGGAEKAHLLTLLRKAYGI